MEVEADPHQTLLARRDEDPLPLGRALEQELALEDGGERCRRDRQVRVEARARSVHSRDDRRRRLREAAHERRAERTAPDEGQRAAAPEGGACGRTGTSALRAVTDHDERLDVPALAAPQRDLGRHAQLDQQPQLELGRHERRKLEHERAGARRSVEVEARRLARLPTCLGQRPDGDLDVGGVELALRGERGDDHADVEAGRQAVGGVRRAGALVCPVRRTVRRLEVRMDAALCVAEKAPVGALEPGGAVARRVDDEAWPTIGPLAAGAGARKGRHQERASGALSPDPDPHGSIPPLPARRGARRLPALEDRVRSSSTISVSTSAALFPSPEPQQEYRSSTPLSARARPRPRRRRRRSRPISRRPA